MTLTTLPLSDGSGTLSYRQAGTGAPVVLIHGVGMQSAAWEPQIEFLSGDFAVYALDMPGHGSSSPLPDGSQLPDFVDWLSAALQTLELNKVSLAGHSMGALIALGYAATYPAALHRVALLNAVYMRGPSAREAVIKRADNLGNGFIDTKTPLDRWFDDTPQQALIRARVRKWLCAMDPASYRTAYSAFARGDDTYADQLGKISCPLLALTGDGDQNSTPEMAQTIAKGAPLGRALVIAGHRHMVNLTAPQTVNMALSDWLETSAKVQAT